MRTLKKAQDGATTPRQRQDSIIAAKRAQAAEKKAKSDAFWNKEKENFNQKAKDRGMTPEQYSKHLDKQKKKPDAFQGDGGFEEKRYNPVCGKGGCKSGKSGLRIKKAQNGTATPNYKNIKKPTQIRSVRKDFVPTAKDSTRYESGFKDAMKGKNKLFPSRARLQGYREAKERGLAPKAKDGMWMQKAAASIKKRGTAGKCTPITKPGCTGKAKALAKTFKKIAKKK